MTGIDESTLNYWMREGVLRASEGGEGRGSHRRFNYREVTLAALLQELRGYGIGTPSLAQIASRFHDALDWMAACKISDENMERILDLLRIQKQILQDGYCAWTVRSPEDEAWFAGFEKHYEGLSTSVEMNWEQAVAHWFRPHPKTGLRQQPSPQELALVRSWKTEADFALFEEMELYWEAISDIRFEEPKDPEGDGAYFFRRNEIGDWHLSYSARSRSGSTSISFIGIDMAMLTYRLWKDWAERSGSALAAQDRKWGQLR